MGEFTVFFLALPYLYKPNSGGKTLCFWLIRVSFRCLRFVALTFSDVKSQPIHCCDSYYIAFYGDRQIRVCHLIKLEFGLQTRIWLLIKLEFGCSSNSNLVCKLEFGCSSNSNLTAHQTQIWFVNSNLTAQQIRV